MADDGRGHGTMGFLDKAKAAANDLAAKADTALAGAGLGGGSGAYADPDSYLRDLGVLSYLQATGRPVDDAERQRVLEALQQMETGGQLRSLTVRTGAGPVPGQPGAMGYAPPAPGAGTPPPPAPSAPPAPGVAAPPAPSAPPAPGSATPTPSSAPPPPPSWA
ncbi:MAG: hypothetical protein KJ548_08635 [Actinobacteria bacterium]|nr:hypothetical protein [Actinomycetota bacterium]MCG2798924.1 hypothetical protein [Cellulomonas sp.]